MKKIASIFKFLANRKRITIPAIIVILILAFIFRPRAPKPPATQKVSRGDIVQSVSITGSVTAENSVNLSFLVSGKLVYLGVHKGDLVQPFQTIATLDERTAQKNLEIALTAYSKQRLTFDQTQNDNQNRTPEQALNDKMRRLLQDNQYDLNKSVQSVELQALTKETSILSTPIKGIVTREDVTSAGLNVFPQTTFTVTDPNSLDFTMEVDETDIGMVKTGDEVQLKLDSYPNKTINLAVDNIDFVTHKTSTGGDAYNVKAKITGDNSDYHLRIGMNGNAEIITKKKNNVLVIPLSSIVDNDKVVVKTQKGYVKKTIKIGLQNDTSAEILSGLRAGEEIVTEPTLVPQLSKL